MTRESTGRGDHPHLGSEEAADGNPSAGLRLRRVAGRQMKILHGFSRSLAGPTGTIEGALPVDDLGGTAPPPCRAPSRCRCRGRREGRRGRAPPRKTPRERALESAPGRRRVAVVLIGENVDVKVGRSQRGPKGWPVQRRPGGDAVDRASTSRREQGGHDEVLGRLKECAERSAFEHTRPRAQRRSRFGVVRAR